MAFRRLGRPAPRRGRRYTRRKRTYGRRGKKRFPSRRVRRTRRTGYRKIARIARKAVLEKKYFDQNYAAAIMLNDQVGNSPNAVELWGKSTGIVQGTGNGQRTGNEILAAGTELTIDVKMHQTATDYDPIVQRWTLMLVKQTGIAGLSFAEIFKEPLATRRSPYKKVTERTDNKNFEVMWRRNFKFDIRRLGAMDPGATAASLSVTRPAGITKVRYHVYVPTKLKVKWKVGTDIVHPYTYYLYYWQNEVQWLNGSASTTNELNLEFVKIRFNFSG